MASREPEAIVITGVGHRSLGESLVWSFLDAMPESKIIGVDREPSTTFASADRFISIPLDINPLAGARQLEDLQDLFQRALAKALDGLSCSGIKCLIQSAGVYEAGRLLQHCAIARSSVVGVNFVARVELLFAVLRVNQARGIKCEEQLCYLDVGSTHGLANSAGRPLYAATKAAGLDLCIAIDNAREVARCIHFAPGPIDTHMLHRNHWVTKADGPPDFFDAAFAGQQSLYEKTFIECDEKSFCDLASRIGVDPSCLLACFRRYSEHRRQTAGSAEGILSAQACARLLCRIVRDSESFDSGTYVATAPGGTEKLRKCRFRDLTRFTLFERVV